jgi:choline dehydrogenase-like flavoprotein
MNAEDRKRWNAGLDAINNIFSATGAIGIIPGTIPIGLHLMGGCCMGVNPDFSVVSPDFSLHEDENVFIADSSIFPNAPGINPSFTIMALSLVAAEKIDKSFKI